MNNTSAVSVPGLDGIQGSTNVSVAASARGGKKAVDLQLETGLCLLRKVSFTGLSKKELESALQLWAEESLPLPMDRYYLDHWQISSTEQGLAAIPRELLSSERDNVHREGRRVAALHVRELCEPRDRRPGLIIWPLSTGLLVCFWRDRVLTDWQSFPASLTAEFVIAQLGTTGRQQPEWIMRAPGSAKSSQEFDQLNEESVTLLSKAKQRWPEAEWHDVDNWPERKLKNWFGNGPIFEQFVLEHKFKAATTSDKWRLGVALPAVVISISLLVMSDLQQREAEVEILRQHDAVASVRARRSEQVALRSGQTLQQVYELLALTVERKGVLDALRVVSDALPPSIKFEAINIDSAGAIELEGSAETETDISTLLQRLGESPSIRNPVLAFAQKGKANATQQDKPVIQFRIEMLLDGPLLSLPTAEGDGA